jgi:Orsellinic acid/F9775 biosynthesis cluster protein D
MTQPAMDLFHYYSEYRVLVCKSCQYSIQPGRLVSHLRAKQHKLTQQQAAEIANRYADKQLADPCTERIAPIIPIKPIEYLPIYRDGLACNHCHFVCRTRNWILRHQREVHDIRIGRGRRQAQPEWTSIWCQCFFISAGQHYFQVQQTSRPTNTEGIPSLLQLIHQQLDQEEKLEQEKRNVVKNTADATEISPWLEKTEWIRHLEGQNKAAIVQLVKPAKPEELGLKEVEKSLDRLVRKAMQTILKKKVSMFLLHRAKSYEAGKDSREVFHIKNYDETIQRYQRIWNQVLMYILRTASAEYSESRLYRLTQKQQYAIRDVVPAVNRFQLYEKEDLTEEDIEAMQQELDKYCLHFCITLLDHQLDGDEYESAILSGLAAMSLEYIPGSEALYRFRKPVQYTPLLAGFLKVAKMLTI